MKWFICDIKAELFTVFDKLPYRESVNIFSGLSTWSRTFYLNCSLWKKTAAAILKNGFISIHATESNS